MGGIVNNGAVVAGVVPSGAAAGLVAVMCEGIAADMMRELSQ
jgi:hypothetical protein